MGGRYYIGATPTNSSPAFLPPGVAALPHELHSGYPDIMLSSRRARGFVDVSGGLMVTTMRREDVVARRVCFSQ